MAYLKIGGKNIDITAKSVKPKDEIVIFLFNFKFLLL